MTEEEKQTIREFVERVERRAEEYMLETHKLEGMHYKAMKDLLREEGINGKKRP